MKWRHVSETDDEVEMIDEDVALQKETVEEVDAEGSEQMVRTYFYWEYICSLISRTTALMNINTDWNLRKSLSRKI